MSRLIEWGFRNIWTISSFPIFEELNKSWRCVIMFVPFHATQAAALERLDSYTAWQRL